MKYSFGTERRGETFSHKCRAESESLLGFFWNDSQQCDIVIVKTSGLDLYGYNSQSKSLQLVETEKLNVSWYVYTHESRLVLLASGMQCKTFHGFQISSADIARLPRFEMVMAKSEANSKPVLASEDVYIITVYGRIYCLQVDRVAMLLHLYRLYRDAVIQQAKQLCLGITQALILEHRPVPVIAKALHVLVTSYSLSIKTGSYFKGLKPEKTSASGVQSAGADVSAIGSDEIGKSIIHEGDPRVDRRSFSKALSLDSEDEYQSAYPKCNSKEAQVESEVNESSSNTESHSAYFIQSSLQSGQDESQLTSAAISPDEMHSFVFSPVDEEMVGDPSYLVAIIIEFLHSADLEKIEYSQISTY